MIGFCIVVLIVSVAILWVLYRAEKRRMLLQTLSRSIYGGEDANAETKSYFRTVNQDTESRSGDSADADTNRIQQGFSEISTHKSSSRQQNHSSK